MENWVELKINWVLMLYQVWTLLVWAQLFGVGVFNDAETSFRDNKKEAFVSHQFIWCLPKT